MTSQTQASNLAVFDEFFVNTLKPRLFNKYATQQKDGQQQPNQQQGVLKVIKRFEEMVDYNVPHGKKLRGLCTYESLKSLTSDKEVSTDLINQSKSIGWCIEFMQASFLVADDMMDNSTYRRGKLCWYLHKEVGNVAINDSFFLLGTVQLIITEFCANHQMYTKLTELFNKTLLNTVVGQGLDLITPPKVEPGAPFDFNNYTQQTYDSIVIWKTAYYSFCLPVQSALLLVGIDSPEVHAKCESILIAMGHYFQVQDDYLDCYADPKVIGKVGTDIEEGKCGWLVIQALRKASAAQRTLLETNYGRDEAEKVALVKQVFIDLKLEEEYKAYELEKYSKIMEDIDELRFTTTVCEINGETTEKIKSVLKTYAVKIFKRTK